MTGLYNVADARIAAKRIVRKSGALTWSPHCQATCSNPAFTHGPTDTALHSFRAVPEPTSAALILAGATALLLRRRR